MTDIKLRNFIMQYPIGATIAGSINTSNDNSSKIIKMLVDSKADVNQHEYLYAAIKLNAPNNVIKTLIESKANVFASMKAAATLSDLYSLSLNHHLVYLNIHL